ncbi:hypothetical protein BSZ35_05125 [Salinibacter sp. 10B]|uniref:cadherin domain-containing protein n=1 Tax=Salinibacter sp. 10B TaxID=1923971 RepID=UPI000D27EDD7|nr:cadherin domain-containing protein [Salinibacter sp. 10B]PQJ34073.1 hypothetical protein BSZ35_05125 [Salinibacter sp. 10B]
MTIDDGSGTSQSLSQVYGFTDSGYDGHWLHADFDSQAWPSGSTITVKNGSTDPLGFCAIEVSGLEKSNAVDVTSGNFNPSRNINAFSGSVTTTQAQELLLGITSFGFDGVIFADPGANFTKIAETDNGNTPDDGNAEGNLMLATREVSSKGTYESTAFLEAQDFWNASIIGLKIQANASPTFTAGSSTSLSVDEDAAATSLNSQLEVDDPDGGQTLEWTVSAAPSNGSLSGFPTTAGSGTEVQPSGLTYDPNPDVSGSDAFDVQVSDGNGGSATITVNVTVNNLPPAFNSSNSASVPESSTGTVLDVNADDGGEGSNDSGVNYTLSGGADEGVFNIDVNTGELTLDTALDYENPTDSDGNNDYVVEVSADDGESSNNIATQTITVTVTDVNDPPTLALGSTSGSVDENNSPPNVLTSITINDPDGGTNNLSLSGPDAGDFNINGSNELEFTATADFESKSSYDVTVEVSDPNAGTDSQDFTLSITDVPDLQITDGASQNLDFTAQVSPGSDDNPVGLLKLVAEETGAAFTGATISNNAPGVSGIKRAALYWSTDQNFDPGSSDPLLAAFDVTDNSAEATFTFSGFNQPVPSSNGFFFLAIDVASSAPDTDVRFSLDGLTVSKSEIATVNGTSQSSFSALPLSNGSTALPVELARFDATTSKTDGVTLQWQTISETDNAGFDVQRRVASAHGGRRIGSSVKPSRRDGLTEDQTWQTVGSVDGAGTTTEAQSYHFEDADVPYAADSLTYRLKQVDTNGTTSYSDPLTVSRPSVQRVQLLGTSPNPARTQAMVRFAIPKGSSKHVALHLYDVMGRQVRTVQTTAEPGRHTLQFTTDHLSSGVYFLRLQAGSTVRTQRLTVVR